MTGPRRVAVLGAGGHAKVLVATLQATGIPLLSLFDDDETKWGTNVLGVPVRGPLESVASEAVDAAVIGVGDNRVRQALARRLDLPWVAVVHPAAVVHPSVRLGAGSVVFAGAVLQPDSVLGRHVIVNTCATVDHDCHVGDFAHLAPGCHLAGEVTVEEGAFLGISSAVIPGRRVGAWATVGAGGAVVRNVPPGVIARGVPARAQSKGRGN